MVQFSEYLNWINEQESHLVNLLVSWASINSHSDNIEGLKRMTEALKKHCSVLEGEIELIELPPRVTLGVDGKHLSIPHGQALRITKRAGAVTKVFLGGHMDTVFAKDHPFQHVERIDNNTLRGPGVADMKGGLVIMLTALQALERHPDAKNIGWEVIINPDEEVGSLGSQKLLEKAAQNNDLGLIFEPSFSDGAIVSSRKGSVNIDVFAKGKAAHAGRDFHVGRSAILGLAEFIVKANKLCEAEKSVTINFGCIHGGDSVNIVPENALCKLNMRAINTQDFANAKRQLESMAAMSSLEGITLTTKTLQSREPKIFTKECQNLFNSINSCAQEEGYLLSLRPSGGVCDGNILASGGLPVIDSLGVIGNELHTNNESMQISSLVQRSRLVALFLLKLATGDDSWRGPHG